VVIKKSEGIMKKVNCFTAWAIAILVSFSSFIIGQDSDLKKQIESVIQGYNAKIGVAVQFYHSGEIITVNDENCYPMQSVYKFPLALAVLHEVDSGHYSLDKKIRVTKEDLLPNTWSPLREKYPEGDVDITIRELISYTVGQSDNNGCDILFRMLGGPIKVDEYVKDLGVENMHIFATEEEMHQNWEVQYKNCSTPSAMLQVLKHFYQGNILSEESYRFLWDVMTERRFGLRRIMGELPEDVTVAHKTGTSGRNESGLAAATNDVGIVVPGEGKEFAIVVYVSDSTEEEVVREKIISEIAKLTFDYYTN